MIRARYPLLYVVSWEEARVEQALAALAKRRGKKIFFWSVTKGMCDPEQVCDAGVKDPQAGLDYVLKSTAPGLFVMKDFHPFLQDAGIIRKLRDLIQELKSSYKTLILLSPVLTVPVELEKDICVIDYDLPGPSDLNGLLDDIVKMVASSGVKLELESGDREKLIQAALGLTLSEAENAFAKAIVLDGKLSSDDLQIVLEEKKQIIRKSRLLEFFEAKEALAEIGGMDLLKEWLKKRGQAFSEAAREFGLPQPRGILLLGVQGCGKSLTCKTISGLWNLPLLRLDMGSIFGGIVGQSEENMRRSIKTAESLAPCILWLDEIEKGLSGVQSSNFSDAGTTSRVFSTFLTWLQEKTAPVFVAATANNISLLPPELLRKGRLDEIFFVDLPMAKERRDIFIIHLKKRKRDPQGFDLERLTNLSEGFSGAEIEQAVISALYDSFSEKKDLTTENIEKALKETFPLSKTMKEQIGELRDWAKSRARMASAVLAQKGDGARKIEI